MDQLPDVESLLELSQEESKQLFKNNEDLFAELEQKHQEDETISLRKEGVSHGKITEGYGTCRNCIS